MTITFGLPRESLEAREGSIGASDTRIICNGTDAEVFALWEIKSGRAEPADLDDNIYCQMGQFIEPFTQNWFERRTGLDVGMRGEHITNPDYPGLHVTLDGFLHDLAPKDYRQTADFKFAWGCHKPRVPVEAVFEMKFRDGMQFKPDEQVKTFMPQLHQGMALTGAKFAVLATLTTPLAVHCRVVPFDQFYWAECFARISDFQEAVRDDREPLKFPPLKTAKVQGVQAVKTVLRTVDMSKDKSANEWAACAAMLAASLPTDEDKRRAKRETQAKDGMKSLIGSDVGIASGFGVTAKRNGAGAISFEVDEKAIADAKRFSAGAAA
jgi:hypothetical protein